MVLLAHHILKETDEDTGLLHLYDIKPLMDHVDLNWRSVVMNQEWIMHTGT